MINQNIKMNWLKLESIEQLQTIKDNSSENLILIFKHSTRCSISRSALDRLERNWQHGEMNDVKPFYLDLIKYRDVSDKIAEDFSVEHESPQVLVIKNGQSVYDRSHIEINYRELAAIAQEPPARY